MLATLLRMGFATNTNRAPACGLLNDRGARNLYPWHSRYNEERDTPGEEVSNLGHPRLSNEEIDRRGEALYDQRIRSLVDTDALVAELRSGRLSAVLDVTDPEPLPADSPLHELPGAFVTPHLAGSQGNELARLGLAVVDEAQRVVSGAGVAFPVAFEALARGA